MVFASLTKCTLMHGTLYQQHIVKQAAWKTSFGFESATGDLSGYKAVRTPLWVKTETARSLRAVPSSSWSPGSPGFPLHVSDILSVKSFQSDPGQPQERTVGPGDSKDKQQLLTEDPGLPGWADVRICCYGRPVQPLAPRLRQPDGEILLIPLPCQCGL